MDQTSTKGIFEGVLTRSQSGEILAPNLVNNALISAQKRIKELEKQNKIDNLTKVFSRNYFDINLAEKFQINNEITFLMVDIDDFKKVNDTKGHQKGDKILYSVAKILKQYTRKNDIVYRYGGEEFGIILTNTNAEASKKVIEKLRKKVQKEIGVTISIGAVFYSKDINNHKSLIKKADEALYIAKSNGKNCAVLCMKKRYLPVTKTRS